MTTCAFAFGLAVSLPAISFREAFRQALAASLHFNGCECLCSCACIALDTHTNLTKAPSYFYRDLTLNQLNGSIPASLGGMSALTSMCVRSSQTEFANFTHTAPSFFCSVLAGNQLTGSIPFTMGSLTMLSVLCVHAPLLHCASAVLLLTVLCFPIACKAT